MPYTLDQLLSLASSQMQNLNAKFMEETIPLSKRMQDISADSYVRSRVLEQFNATDRIIDRERWRQ